MALLPEQRRVFEIEPLGAARDTVIVARAHQAAFTTR
jgi:hypothetical protein